MRSTLLCISIGLLATCADPGLEPTAPPPPGALSLLFVGNSLTYSNHLPLMVEGLLNEADVGPVVVASSSYANYGLQDHWVDSRTHAAIALGGWDFVVLQQGPSATEGRPSLLDYTLRFNDEITAGGARTAHLMVWPSSDRAFDFDGVVESYAMAAQSVGGVLFPAGDAWREAWKLDPTLALYSGDGFHPSVLGSYLAALTIAVRLVGPEFEPSFSIDTPSIKTTIDVALRSQLLAAAREGVARHP